MDITVFGSTREIDERLLEAGPERVRERIRAYERGERLDIGLKVAYPASFTGEVMREIARIPPGSTRTYGDIAKRVDTAPVAVGQACGRNPVPVIVPCHRVVGADSLGGYGGGLELKRRLLAHEGAFDG